MNAIIFAHGGIRESVNQTPFVDVIYRDRLRETTYKKFLIFPENIFTHNH
jgi:hypothetical protein